MPNLIKHLIGILGKRALVAFGIVTLLVAALLATVNLASRYAIKNFVEDQLERIPWDIVVYQTEGVRQTEELTEQLTSVEGIEFVGHLAFLRAKLPEGDVAPEVDGEPLGTPWLSLMAASDLSLLPPQIRGLRAFNNNRASQGAVLALVGPERAMGKAFLSLQGARHFSLNVNVFHGQDSFVAFRTPVAGVIRVDRNDLNRWLMDQTGSISFVPHVGVMLFTAYDSDLLSRFEAVATGLLDPELTGMPPGTDLSHIQLGEYIPEVATLARLDRKRLISGWNIQESLDRVTQLRDRLQERIDSYGARSFVDSTTLVLLERMNDIARIIGLLAVLIALPLLWVGWVLAANLSGLLMLNERRTLGLMRLRGIPGRLLGKAFLLAISLGGLAGGILGLVLGSVIPLLIFERGALPLEVLTQSRQVLLLLLYFVITLILALLVSRRLVRYATTISPLEASVRFTASEAAGAAIPFGLLQVLSLLMGSYTLCIWIFNFSLSELFPLALFRFMDGLLDFIGLPLFLYGIVTLLATHKSWIQWLLAPIVKPIGGRLGPLAVKHISLKPHRMVSFLLIVSLMASVSLYPTVTSRSFEEKAERGARVQMGTDLQLIFNSPELADAEELHGELADQRRVLESGLMRILEAVRQVEGVRSVIYMLEAVLPHFYLPGHGLRGVPLYLIGNIDAYLQNVYAEPELGIGLPFEELVSQLGQGRAAVSPSVAEFWRISSQTPILMGVDTQRRSISVPASGVLAFLPGTPPLTITDRQGYVQARLDYLNHLFNSNAYLVAAADNPALSSLDVLIPRVIVLVGLAEGVSEGSLQEDILRALPVAPLELNNLTGEISKVGSDMFISLALANMRIYLVGGLLLALIAILAVAFANYVEDRRTLALLRIRGTSPKQIWRFFAATLFSPAFLGLVLGILVALIAGYGLANHVWELREIQTAVQLLPSHLVVSPLTFWVALLIMALILGVSWIASWWVFRKTAREDIQEG